MDKIKLLNLIDDDEFDLLNVEPKQTTLTADQRLAASFLEINEFIRKNAREPTFGNGINEHKLHSRLSAIRQSKEKICILLNLGLDEYHLIKQEPKEIRCIDDIFDDDALGILDTDADTIFNLKHVPNKAEMPEYIARREPCNDFSNYEQLFKDCHTDLVANKKILRSFANEQQIESGSFFILKGVMVYVNWVGEKETKNGKVNARLHCIFENGTESDMLLRSLARELYKDGRRIVDVEHVSFDKIEEMTSNDIAMGCIYVLRSISKNPEISSINNLYKIGFTKGSVEDRVKNASLEPTYLMSPVSIVTAYQCYNMHPKKLEQLLHTFFGSACLSIDVFDNDGRRYTPREWFIAPLDIIEQAIYYVLNGEIVKYRYDPTKKIIIDR